MLSQLCTPKKHTTPCACNDRLVHLANWQREGVNGGSVNMSRIAMLKQDYVALTSGTDWVKNQDGL